MRKITFVLLLVVGFGLAPFCGAPECAGQAAHDL